MATGLGFQYILLVLISSVFFIMRETNASKPKYPLAKVPISGGPPDQQIQNGTPFTLNCTLNITNGFELELAWDRWYPTVAFYRNYDEFGRFERKFIAGA